MHDLMKRCRGILFAPLSVEAKTALGFSRISKDRSMKMMNNFPVTIRKGHVCNFQSFSTQRFNDTNSREEKTVKEYFY